MRPRLNLNMPEVVVAYVGGEVHALDPLNGATLWCTALPKAYRQSTGTVLVEGDVVLAGVGGRLYCLDLTDGRILWVNDFPGRGLGMVAMATRLQSTGSQPAAHQELMSQRQSAAGASAAAV